jgi:signal transduction histidine kinase
MNSEPAYPIGETSVPMSKRGRWPLAQHLSRFASQMVRSIGLSVQYSGPKFIAVGSLAVIGFPLYYVIWHHLFPQPYENLPLRLVGSLLFIPLLVAPWWPQKLRRCLPIYWYIAILYALPFFFTFMYLNNGGSHVWSMSVLIAIFLMILLVDWLNLIVMCALGILFAWVAYVYTADVVRPPAMYLSDVAIYLFAILAGSAFNLSAERVKQERLSAMLTAASNIAHELRTPLLGVKSAATGLRRYLPALLEGYRLARERGLAVPDIRAAHYESMQESLTRIEQETDHSNTIIDILLINSRQPRPTAESFSSVSMARCVEACLERYPFSSQKERERVVWEKTADFRFTGSEVLMVHVFFNLMKNAQHSVAKAGSGEIRIWLTPGETHNTVHFRDTGLGIPAQVLPRIFERFYSWSTNSEAEHGTGVGLAFCKTVVASFGGRITCHSVSGAFAEFVMTFPGGPANEAVSNPPVLLSDHGHVRG